VFAAFAALTQLGIAPELIAPTFLILLGGVTSAAAIAFGLGGQGVAQRIVEDGYQKGDEAKQQIQEQNQQNQQEEHGQQQSDSSSSVEGDGQKLEAPASGASTRAPAAGLRGSDS
jgi:hypothetical protein